MASIKMLAIGKGFWMSSMTEKMIITEFTRSDSEELVELWQECGLVAPHNNPHKDIQRKLKHGRDLFLVGRINNELVATVMGGYDGHRGWVNYLGVKPSSQRQGYGAMIIDALEARLRDAGCAKINLQVRSSNQPVIEFYHSLGFVDDDVVSLGKRLEID